MTLLTLRKFGCTVEAAHHLVAERFEGDRASMAESLSYAQSLRVVGQDLDALGIHSFDLAKWDADYIVWPKRAEPAKPGVLSKITHMILGDDQSVREVPNRLYFAASKITVVDAQRRSNRRLDSPSDRRDISFVLRVLGDYLDRKNVGHFTIAWDKDSTVITYGQEQETFTSENLYDFGIRMYLRRSNRGGAK
jgi:hypothetical protein